METRWRKDGEKKYKRNMCSASIQCESTVLTFLNEYKTKS